MVFASVDNEEIANGKDYKHVQLPNDFKQYLNKFNCFTAAIRRALDQRRNWEDDFHKEEYFDLDWANCLYTLCF